MNNLTTHQFHIRPYGLNFSASVFYNLVNRENPKQILTQLDDLIVFPSNKSQIAPHKNTLSQAPSSRNPSL